MNKDDKQFFPCDAESELNNEHADYHACMEISTSWHKDLDKPFLSFFTKREKKGNVELGTEVWLDVDSVRLLIGELADWALKNGAELSDIADEVGLLLAEDEEEKEDEDVEFELKDEFEECPFCLSPQIVWSEKTATCGKCAGVFS